MSGACGAFAPEERSLKQRAARAFARLLAGKAGRLGPDPTIRPAAEEELVTATPLSAAFARLLRTCPTCGGEREVRNAVGRLAKCPEPRCRNGEVSMRYAAEGAR